MSKSIVISNRKCNALGWFGLFVISSIVLIPILMIVGFWLDWNVVVDGTFAIYDIMLTIQNGTFSAEILSKEILTVASNYILISLLISYIPPIIVMLFRIDIDGGYGRVEVLETFKWLAIITSTNCVLEFIMSFFLKIPALAQATIYLDSVASLSTSGNPILVFLAIGIMAPIVEEIVFRRGVQRNLYKYKRVFRWNVGSWFGIISASILFGVMHMNLFQGVCAALMGVILGCAYYKTNNLWYPTLMHMAVNCSAIAVTLVEVNSYIAYMIISVIFGLGYLVLKKLNK